MTDLPDWLTAILMTVGWLLTIAIMVPFYAFSAEASTPTDAAADRVYCRVAVAEQIKEQRSEDAQNELVNTAINALSGAMLGQDFGRSIAYAGRSAAYGTVNRTRMNQYQKRAIMQQCMMERKRDR